MSRFEHPTAEAENRGWASMAPYMFNLTITVMELIRDGVDVNESGHEDKTALHLAAARGYRRMCSILLETGADVNAKSNGETPLDFAKSLNHSSTVKFLSNWGDDRVVDKA